MKIDNKKMLFYMANAKMNTAYLINNAGISSSTIKNISEGKSVRPYTIGKIAAALGVPAESLILDEKAEQKRNEAERADLLLKYATLSEKQQELTEKGLDVAAGIIAKELEKIQKRLGN